MLNRRLFGIPIWAIIGVLVLAVVAWILFNWGTVLNAGEDVLEFIFYPDERIDEVILCEESNGCQFWHPIIYSAILLAVVVTGFAYTTLLERKLVAWFQHRVGPDRVGPWGLLQPAADGVKLIFKENIKPEQADIWVYRLAPMLKALPTLIVLAVIPLGPPINIPWFDGNWYRVPMSLADTSVGILWILGITSLGTYGVALAGWSSNNKYALLGGLRASAQMISYELSMGLGLAVPVLIVGSMNITDIVEAQMSGIPFINWFVFQNPLAAAVLIVALVAEVNRAPFDLPEAEQELTAGFMTEYSGMKFALFMMAEYLGMIAVSLIAVSTFFGGYDDGFGLVNYIPILGPLVVLGKVFLCLCAFVWIRATLPRIRYDRLMSLGWKVMLPLALLAVCWTAVAVVIGEELGQAAYVIFSIVMFAIVAVGGTLLLSRSDASVETDDHDYETDPVITGEREGIGHALLALVGGLLGILVWGYEATITILERLAALGERTEEPPAEDTDDSTPALPAESSGD